MTSKAEFIAQFKADYATIQTGSDEAGYTQLTVTEYDAKIAEWADNALAKEIQEAEAQAILAAKIAAQAKLAALGLTTDDLKALGL